MVDGFSVLVNLAQEGTNLHVSLAFIFKHLQPQRWLLWVIKVALKIIALEMIYAGLQADGALFKDA